MAFFSLETELTSNVKLVEKGFTGAALTTFFEDRATEADKELKVDCSLYLDFTKINTTDGSPTTPDFVNLLAQYKTAELSLARLAGAKRKIKEQNDIDYYIEKYDKLKDKIKDNAIDLVDVDGTDVSKSKGIFEKPERTKKGVLPRFGYNTFGRFADDDRLKELRDTETEEDSLNG